MRHSVRRLWIGFLFTGCVTEVALAQKTMTWQEVRDEFERSNPTLRAAQIGIDESRAEEVTAFLRPNPDLSVGLDQLDFFSNNPTYYRPFAYTEPEVSASYLHERRHKRELRLESAEGDHRRSIAVGGPGKKSDFQFAQCIRANAPSQSGPRIGSTEPGLLRS
jgi:hypothetical protein